MPICVNLQNLGLKEPSAPAEKSVVKTSSGWEFDGQHDTPTGAAQQHGRGKQLRGGDAGEELEFHLGSEPAGSGQRAGRKSGGLPRTADFCSPLALGLAVVAVAVGRPVGSR
jgi:hypothetical protein